MSSFVSGIDQVKFTTIWHCDPLLEDEFYDAIQDNYFDTYKFNFGLSKDQVFSFPTFGWTFFAPFCFMYMCTQDFVRMTCMIYSFMVL